MSELSPALYELTVPDAIERLLDGGLVRMTVGLQPDDPVCELRNEDGMIVSTAVAGWSEGIEEPVCEEHSDFLRTFLAVEKLEAIGPEAEPTVTLTITQSEASALARECSCCNTRPEHLDAWGSLRSKNHEAMKGAGWR